MNDGLLSRERGLNGAKTAGLQRCTSTALRELILVGAVTSQSAGRVASDVYLFVLLLISFPYRCYYCVCVCSMCLLICMSLPVCM